MTGTVVEVAPGLRRILAPNPGPMTYRGTNTYLLGQARVSIVDPGPAEFRHLAAILKTVAGGRVERILVTHAHLDHSALAPALSRETGAPILAYGPPEAGRSARMRALARAGLAGGGEGVDAGFRPDATLADGDRLDCEGATVEVLHTPGHFAGHLGFGLGDALISGDHVMGWSTTLISPPDGDLAAFYATTERLAAQAFRVCHPGHGDPVSDPRARLAELVAHRKARDRAIMDVLDDAPATIEEITGAVYQDIPLKLLPVARRNVFAHLIAACDGGRVRATPVLSPDATYAAVA